MWVRENGFHPIKPKSTRFFLESYVQTFEGKNGYHDKRSYKNSI